jgi:hypothetical protein
VFGDGRPIRRSTINEAAHRQHQHQQHTGINDNSISSGESTEHRNAIGRSFLLTFDAPNSTIRNRKTFRARSGVGASL